MNIVKMTDLDLHNKRVLIREDLNVPVKNGLILSEARLKAALPTLQLALESGASVLVLSHLGRPKEGEYSKENSLSPIAVRLSEMLGVSVGFAKEYLDGVNIGSGQITLCENVRFNVGERKGSEELAKQYASLCDIFVMDAFGTAHRAQASTQAVALYAPVACAGPLLVRELEALEHATKQPQNPVLAIIGGSKVSTKLTVLNALCKKVDTLIVGGGIANNFLKAAGYEVGRSLYEPDLVDEAKHLLALANQGGAAIPIPLDVVVASECSSTSPSFIKDVEHIGSEDMILDIGPKTSALYDKIVAEAATIMWNGPVGVFEIDQFSQGTKLLGQSIAKSNAFSIAGGGDTLAAIEKYNLSSDISYLSTGGGAFLEFVEGKQLPAIAALEKRFKG